MKKRLTALLLALTLLLCSLPGWAAGMAVSAAVGGVSIAVDDDDAVTAATVTQLGRVGSNATTHQAGSQTG